MSEPVIPAIQPFSTVLRKRLEKEIAKNRELRTALDDARGALEEALDWIPDSLPGVRGRLLAILKPSPMNEEPDES